MIEGEESRGGVVKIPFIPGAEIAIGVEVEGFGFTDEGDGDDPFTISQAGGDGFGEPGLAFVGDGEAILNDRKKEIFVLGG
jgi:hypothetical protein